MGLWAKSHNLQVMKQYKNFSLLSFSYEPLEEEDEEVWECVELAIEADVLVAELDAILDR